MGSITIGVFGDKPEGRQQVASSLAKKGGAEDITQYQTVYSGKIITVIEPTRYPEKADVLAYAAFLSDYCIVIAESLTPALGEIIVTLDLLGKEKGCIITNIELDNLLKGTTLEKYDKFDSFEAAREKIMGAERGGPADLGGGPASAAEIFASVDHSFEVKGVGSIILGFLHSGKILVHDKLTVHPSGKELEVRSIQMHDQDVKEAGAGDRFGLAIRLLASKDVERGDLLTKSMKINTGKEHQVNASLSKFAREPLRPNEQVHAVHFLEDAPCRWQGDELIGGNRGSGKLVFEKPFSIHPGFPVLIVRLDAKGLRIIGKASI
ncbi:MAG TPA: EF-Tu/IF-2/RF-3 family GTPase [Candidatus Norongarragalinales archaeon]|nr:EF-Tu/IF-2/RF-3 family GTPase [Candidatus Norongarragalinales archaeon]